MTKPHLKLYCDIVSPFGYIAWYVTRHSPVFQQCDVEHVPVFLGGIMQACGNRPPLEIKNKDTYVNFERSHYARLFSVPMTPTMPSPFPQLTVGVMRCLTLISTTYPDKLEDCYAALYHAFWVEAQTISKVEVYGKVLAGVLGEALAKEVVEGSGGKEVKALLTERTKVAVEEGAFGMPWFVATNAKGETKGFWGMAHLGFVVDHLGLKRGKEGGLRAML